MTSSIVGLTLKQNPLGTSLSTVMKPVSCSDWILRSSRRRYTKMKRHLPMQWRITHCLLSTPATSTRSPVRPTFVWLSFIADKMPIMQPMFACARHVVSSWWSSWLVDIGVISVSPWGLSLPRPSPFLLSSHFLSCLLFPSFLLTFPPTLSYFFLPFFLPSLLSSNPFLFSSVKSRSFQIQLGVCVGALQATPAESGVKPQPKSNLEHFSFKMWHLVTTM